MKCKQLIFFSFIVLFNLNASAQLTAGLYYGDILFSIEASTVTKKKEMTSLEIFSPEEALFGNVFFNIRMKSHPAFSEKDDHLLATVTIAAKTGENTTFTLEIDAEKKDDKRASFEIIPETLDMENPYHLKLSGFLSKLPADTNSLIITIGHQKGDFVRTDGFVVGKIDVDLSKGLGKFQALKDEQDRLEKIAEEERLAKEAEEKRLAEERAALRKKTRDEYFNARNAVKISFRNTCGHYGSIRIVTGSEFTNQSTTVDGQSQSGQYTCRPGDKVYNSDGKLLHTVSSSSNNKVISFCPPKTQEMIDREDFDRGAKSISVSIRNSCSDTKIYYNHESGASTSKTWMGSNSSTSLSMRKGDKIWIADQNGNNVSVIFEAVSLSQYGSDVYLCR